jgi:hypothetical protein
MTRKKTAKPLRQPLKIMVIRHAEKPTGATSGAGVTRQGKRENECLTIRGWQRSGALAAFFAPTNGSFSDPALAKPQFLFASKPTRRNGSRRPIDTITPLSEKLALGINSQFQKDDIEAMLKEVFSCVGVVLICWQQEFIPDIANHILGRKKVAPPDWPDDRFDMVWVFDRDTLTDRYSFHQVPQCLLMGDSSTPIKR